MGLYPSNRLVRRRSKHRHNLRMPPHAQGPTLLPIPAHLRLQPQLLLVLWQGHPKRLPSYLQEQEKHQTRARQS